MSRGNVHVLDGSCCVLVDDAGAFVGVEMPDGTAIPYVESVTVEASVDEIQRATIRLPVRVHRGPLFPCSRGYPFGLDEMERQAKASIEAMYQDARRRLGLAA